MRKFIALAAFLLFAFGIKAQRITPSGTVKICQGQSQVLSITGGSPDSYQWQKDGINIAGEIGPSFTAKAEGEYRVIINGGSKKGDTLTAVTVEVKPNPKAEFSFMPGGQCGNVPVYFTNTSENGSTYLWDFGDPASGPKNTSAAKDPSHVFVGTPGNATQEFNVKLITRTADGCVDSVVKKVTTKQLPGGQLAGTGSGSFNGDNYFSICGNFPTGDFSFSNVSSTKSTNTSYRIVWGDGSPDYTSTTFSDVLQHTYPLGTHKLLFIVGGSNGCIDTTVYYTYVGTNPAVGMSNPGNTAICGESSLTFPVTGVDNNPPGTVYTVSFNDGSTPEVFVHPNIPASITHQFNKTSCGTNSTTGTIYYPNSFSASIRASNPCNSSEATIVPIYVSEKPVAKFVILPNDTVCVDNVVTLIDSSRSSSVYNGKCEEGRIIWSVSPATGWTITSGGKLGNDFNSSNTEIWESGSKTLNLLFSQPGVYTVKLKTGNAYCGLAESTQVICVNPKPTVSYSVDHTEGCAPLTVSTSTKSNTPTCGENKYVWMVDYVPSAECGTYTGKYEYLNDTDSESKEPVFLFTDPGSYHISMMMVAPGGTCSTAVITRTIIVKDKPRVELGDIPDVICQFSSMSPTAVVKCFIDNGSTYLWKFNGATPASSNHADPGTVSFNDAGDAEIELTVTNSCGSATVSKVVKVNPTPVIEDIADISVCAGQTAGPVNIPVDPAAANITWTNNNPSIGLAANGSTGAIPAFTAINEGLTEAKAIVSVLARLDGCTSSKQFNIVAGVMPPAPVVENVEYCLNASATPLSATATPGNQLIWYTAATGGTGSPNAPVPSTSAIGITTYYVGQISEGTGCEGKRVPVSVRVNPIPSISGSRSANPINCATTTGSITLSGLDPSLTYQVAFSKDGIPTVRTAQPNGSGELNILNLPAGIYSDVFVSLAGCPSNVVGPFVLADPNPPDAPAAMSNGPVCLGSDLNLQASTLATGTVTFNWTGPGGFSSNLQNPVISNAALSAHGTYYVSVTQNNCTSASTALDVVVNALPSKPSTSDITYCIDVVASPLTASGNSLLWYSNQTGGTGASAAPTPDTHNSGSTSYYVTQTDMNSCESERAVLNVTVHPNAIARFTPAKTIFCPPFTITSQEIGLQEYPANNHLYQWYIDGVYAGSGVEFPAYTMAVANDSVTVKLVTTSRFGCKTDSMVRKFFTYKLPNPSFTVDKNNGCGPLAVSITNTTEDIDLYNYFWDFGNGQTSTATHPGTIVFNANPTYGDTTYHIKLQMLSECDTITVTKSIHVSSRPKALFSPHITTGCSPMKVIFKNTSRGINNIYRWDFGDGHTETLTSADNVEHTFYSGTVDTFTVRLIASNNCGEDTLKYAIIVSPNNININLAMNGPDHSGCLPHAVALINNSSGAASFQWDFGDGNFLSTSKNIDTVYHTYFDSGSYTISLRAQNNCSDTTVFDKVMVYPKPVASFSSAATRYCKGDAVSFTNQSILATSYLWNFGDGKSSVLENPVHFYNIPGVYNVKLYVFKLNAPGSSCVDSIEKKIEVVESLPGSFSVSDSVAACAPLTVRFSNDTRPSVTATWDFGDGRIATGDEVSHTYLFSGTYTVVLSVEVQGGCIYRTEKTITVNGPSGKMKYTGGNYCSPEPVRFEAEAVNASTYYWDFGDGETLTSTQSVVYHVYNNPGNYMPSLILKNNSGCEYIIRGSDTINVDKIIGEFKTNMDRNCGFTTVEFSDNSFVYSGRNTVSWSFGDGTGAVGNKVSHVFNASGDYNIQMIVSSHAGCTDTVRKVIAVHVNSVPVAGITAEAEACSNLPVKFSGTFQSIDQISFMQWEISDGVKAMGKDLDYVFTTPGIYQVRLVAGTINGCYDTAFHTIVIKPSPNIKAGTDVTICKGNSAQLNVTGAIRYQWTPLQGLSCTECASPVAFPDISTPYVVAGFNDVGCPAYDTVNVTVIQPLRLNVPGNDSVCIGESAYLNVSGAASYQWSPSTSLSSNNIPNPVASPKVTTTYRVIGYDGHNCFTDTAFITVAVGDFPIIDLGPDQTLPTGTMLPLKSVVKNGPVRKWEWTPATDLDCPDCPEPVAHIKNDITYAVEITTAYNCRAADTISIKVFCKSAQVFIPNAFSPDGDGINDVLMVRATGIAMVKSFRIFNRWGQLVFERNNFSPNEPSFGWDGKVRGVPQPPGVYVYTAEVLCENNVPYTYKGNTTILK